MAKTLRERLSEVLIEKKLITEDKFKEALRVQRTKGGRLSKILVDLGFITESDLVVLLSEELRIPVIDLGKYRIDTEVAKLVTKEVAKQYQIMPVSLLGKTLTVAMVDPLDIFAIDDMRSLTGFSINPVITTSESIQEAIKRCYEEPGKETAIEDITKEIEETHAELLSEPGKEAAVDSAELIRLTQETPVVKVTNTILSEATNSRASDILIEPLEEKLRIRYKVDGLLQEAPSPPKAMHSGIISRIKVMAGLDIAEHRRPQDGRFKIRMHNREMDFRVSVLPSSFGEKVAIRILDKSQALLDVDKLGFEAEPLVDFKKSAQRPHGMILVCGPAGCGKTTTLYSILKYVDTPEKNVVTVEDPVEYQLDGINQVTSRPDIGLTFAASLRSILRQDPDIVMIGEIRDLETVDIAIKAALTGHLVLSTLHTTTAAGSIVRLVNMGVEPFLITSSLICVAAQRLVRKLCPRCKEPYTISAVQREELKLQSIPGDVVFYRGKGCPACLNTGFAGRTGIVEVLALNPEVRDLINIKAQEHDILVAARKAGMKTLRENGIKKVLAGVTTLEEVLRVTIGE